MAFDPMTAELYSKVISRSIFGFELAIDAILSRSSVDKDRVGRFRTALRNRVSSAARAASAGDVVSPRVTRGDFSAFMMSSAERCSAAYDGAGDSRPATKIMPAKPAIRVLVIMDVSPIRSEASQW
jgi:hypothetical protein